MSFIPFSFKVKGSYPNNCWVCRLINTYRPVCTCRIQVKFGPALSKCASGGSGCCDVKSSKAAGEDANGGCCHNCIRAVNDGESLAEVTGLNKISMFTLSKKDNGIQVRQQIIRQALSNQ